MRPWRAQLHSSSADLLHLAVWLDVGAEGKGRVLPEGLAAPEGGVDAELFEADGEFLPAFHDFFVKLCRQSLWGVRQ